MRRLIWAFIVCKLYKSPFRALLIICKDVIWIWKNQDPQLIWPRGYKTFLLLSSAKHEMFHAIKSQILTVANPFLPKTAEHEKFSANEYENCNYCGHFYIY